MGREYKESAFGAATAYIVRAAARAHMAQPRGATPRLRSGKEAGRTPCPRVAAKRSYPTSEVRDRSREDAMPEGGSQEELPHV